MESSNDIPILVGVGQVTEHGTAYGGLAPQALAAEAARRALADSGRPEALQAQLDVLAAVRTTGDSMPESLRPFVAPFGGPDNFPGAVARRLACDPARLIYSPACGDEPQKLTTEFCGELAAGRCRAVLLVGAEAVATQRQAQAAGQTLDWNETVGGDVEDRGLGIDFMRHAQLERHGLGLPTTIYPLLEQARRGRLGQSRAACRLAMGELFSGFSEVAAANPHAMAPRALTAAQIADPGDGNRPIADPYLKAMVARDRVNQGAAVVLTTARLAAELGIPEAQWVYLHGAANVRERLLLEREDLGASPAMTAAYRGALAQAGLTPGELAYRDLYSCFPIAVYCALEALGMAAGSDGRALTVTGGLPYFGGPGNNYSMHAIVALVERLRAEPGSFGVVGANGGYLSKHAVGVYGTAPCARWQPPEDAALQTPIDALPAPAFTERPAGAGRVETYTVLYQGEQATAAVILGRLAATGERFVALAEDSGTLGAVLAADPLGAPVQVRGDGEVNRFVLDAGPG
jgi:acetyl-CoA C-acetyltransferase